MREKRILTFGQATDGHPVYLQFPNKYLITTNYKRSDIHTAHKFLEQIELLNENEEFSYSDAYLLATHILIATYDTFINGDISLDTIKSHENIIFLAQEKSPTLNTVKRQFATSDEILIKQGDGSVLLPMTRDSQGNPYKKSIRLYP